METMSTRNIGSTSTSFGQQQQVLFNETDKYCGGLKRALEFAYGSVDLNDANGGGGEGNLWRLTVGVVVMIVLDEAVGATDGSCGWTFWCSRMTGTCWMRWRLPGNARCLTRVTESASETKGEEEEVELMSDSEEMMAEKKKKRIK